MADEEESASTPVSGPRGPEGSKTPKGPGSVDNTKKQITILEEIKDVLSLLTSNQKLLFEKLQSSLGNLDESLNPESDKSVFSGLGSSLSNNEDKKSAENNVTGLSKEDEKIKKERNKPGKDKPKVSDILKLPADTSTGSLLLFYKLDEMHKASTAKDKKEKGAKGASFLEKLLGGLGRGIKELFHGIGMGLKSIGKDFKTKMKGILVLTALAGVLFVLGIALQQFTADINWPSVLLGMGFLLATVVVLAIMAKFMKKDLIQKMILLSIVMLIVSVALLSAAFAFKIMSDIDFGKALLGTLVFGAVIAGLVILAKFVDNSLIVRMGLLAVVMVIVGVALLLAGLAFNLFSNIDFGKTLLGILLLAGIMVGLALVAIVAGALLVPLALFSLVMILLAGALLLTALAFRTLTTVPWDTVMPNVTKLAEILVNMIPMFLLGTLLFIPIAIFSAAMIPLSIALLMASAAFGLFSLVPWDKVNAGIPLFMSTLLQMVPMFLAGAALLFPIILFSIAMIPLSIALMLTAGAFALFALVPWEKVHSSIPLFIDTLAQMAPMFWAGAWLLIPILLFSVAMIPLAIALSLLAGAFGLFSLVPWDKVAGSLGSFTSIFDVLGSTFSLVASKLSDIIAFSQASFMLAGAFIATALGFNVLTSIQWEKLEAFSLAKALDFAKGLDALGNGLLKFKTAMAGDGNIFAAIFGSGVSPIDQLVKLAMIANPLMIVSKAVDSLADSLTRLTAIPADKLGSVLSSLNSVPSVAMNVDLSNTNSGGTGTSAQVNSGTNNNAQNQPLQNQAIPETDLSSLAMPMNKSNILLQSILDTLKQINTNSTSGSGSGMSGGEIINISDISAVKVSR